MLSELNKFFQLAFHVFLWLVSYWRKGESIEVQCTILRDNWGGTQPFHLALQFSTNAFSQTNFRLNLANICIWDFKLNLFLLKNPLFCTLSTGKVLSFPQLRSLIVWKFMPSGFILSTNVVELHYVWMSVSLPICNLWRLI